MIKVLLVNGPPGSGKDAVVEIAQNSDFQFKREKFAMPIYKAVSALTGYSIEELEKIKRTDNGQIRELMIHIPEKVIKPLYGTDHFGRICAKRILGALSHEHFIVTDCGFQDEVNGFIDEIKVVNSKIELWQIHRPFCDFKGDSRQWTKVDKPHTMRVMKNSTSYAQYAENVRIHLSAFFDGN